MRATPLYNPRHPIGAERKITHVEHTKYIYGGSEILEREKESRPIADNTPASVIALHPIAHDSPVVLNMYVSILLIYHSYVHLDLDICTCKPFIVFMDEHNERLCS